MSAAARRPEDLAWVRAYGWQALEISRLDGNLSSFGAVFNTVPSPVLDGPLLAQLPSECLCVDLASRQGIDLEAARELGLPHVWARSLPGRLTPRTAAAASGTVYYMLRKGDLCENGTGRIRGLRSFCTHDRCWGAGAPDGDL